MKTIKIIDLLNKIANGEEVPERIKWRDDIWEYDNRMQDYTNGHLMLFEQLEIIRTKEFLNDELEILDEEDEFEDIEEMNLDIDCTTEWNFGEVYDTINQLIKNQKKIITRLKDEK